LVMAYVFIDIYWRVLSKLTNKILASMNTNTRRAKDEARATHRATLCMHHEHVWKMRAKSPVEERIKGRKDPPPPTRLRETKGFRARNSNEKRPNLFLFPAISSEPHPPKNKRENGATENRTGSQPRVGPLFLVLADPKTTAAMRLTRPPPRTRAPTNREKVSFHGVGPAHKRESGASESDRGLRGSYVTLFLMVSWAGPWAERRRVLGSRRKMCFPPSFRAYVYIRFGATGVR
jgi:hypothetical protein